MEQFMCCHENEGGCASLPAIKLPQKLTSTNSPEPNPDTSYHSCNAVATHYLLLWDAFLSVQWSCVLLRLHQFSVWQRLLLFYSIFCPDFCFVFHVIDCRKWTSDPKWDCWVSTETSAELF